LNIFSFFSETAAPISTYFGTKHLWVKGNKNCEFLGPCPPGALRVGQKLSKIDHFSKIFFSTTAHVEEKLNVW
jgi:hypothetical protein